MSKGLPMEEIHTSVPHVERSIYTNAPFSGMKNSTPSLIVVVHAGITKDYII